MSDLTLIHLVSEQTMQNLLPILALRPQRVVQVRSSRPEFEAPARNLCAAVHAVEGASGTSFTTPAFTDVVIPEDSPSIEKSRQCIAELIRTATASVVNFTGGTKLMSVGAYLTASELQAPSLYCDTPRTFVDGKTGLLPALPSVADVARALNVGIVLTAHGLPPDHIKMEQPSAALLAFGREAFRLRQQHPAAIPKWLAETRPRFRNDKDKFVDGQALRQVLQRPLSWHDEPGYDYLSAAAAAGIVRQQQDVFFLNPLPDGPAKQLGKQAEKNFRRLEGSWFELFVCDRMQISGHCIDLRWSVEAKPDAAVETDIVALDRRTLSLLFVSCKVSDEHVRALEHVFETRQRAVRFGGTFAQSAFVFGAVRNTQKRQDLIAACRALRARLLELNRTTGRFRQLQPPSKEEALCP